MAQRGENTSAFMHISSACSAIQYIRICGILAFSTQQDPFTPDHAAEQSPQEAICCGTKRNQSWEGMLMCFSLHAQVGISLICLTGYLDLAQHHGRQRCQSVDAVDSLDRVPKSRLKTIPRPAFCSVKKPLNPWALTGCSGTRTTPLLAKISLWLARHPNSTSSVHGAGANSNGRQGISHNV